MLIWTTVKLALKSLWANKLRSILAMLGIIIGVAAVISMLAIGAGARKSILERVTAMGTNLLVVRPGMPRQGGVRSTVRQRFTVDDAISIAQEIEGVDKVTPIVQGQQQVTFRNENTQTTIYGTAETYPEIRNFQIETGRMFYHTEEEQRARVAVLGSTVAELLFGEQSPLGERIRIGNVSFRVIGTLATKGDQGWFNPDDIILIPYTTAMRNLFGRRFINTIDIQAHPDTDLHDLEERVQAHIRARHRIPEGREDGFHVRNQAEIIELASSQTQIFSILLGGIAGISLFVGGIGIMNIMLVTVTERTREIGVRKAIGARDRDILRQFLLESVLLTGLGGILGIAVGIGGADLFDRFSPFPTHVEGWSILVAVGVSAVTGIFFGYYPATRAARLDPIDALRYE